MVKGKPRRDGSGRGSRMNRGRGGCRSTRKSGRNNKFLINDLEVKEDGDY